MKFDYLYILENFVITGLLKISRNILLTSSLAKTQVSENNTNENIIVPTIEDYQCVHETAAERGNNWIIIVFSVSV